jgi:hypothetical protein
MTLVTAWIPWRRDVDLLVPAGTSTRLDWIQCGFNLTYVDVVTSCRRFLRTKSFISFLLDTTTVMESAWLQEQRNRLQHLHLRTRLDLPIQSVNWKASWQQCSLRGQKAVWGSLHLMGYYTPAATCALSKYRYRCTCLHIDRIFHSGDATLERGCPQW